MTLWRYAQYNGKLFSALLIVDVAGVAAQIRVVQRIEHHPDVRLIFFHRSIIAAVTIPAEIIVRMNDMPLAFIHHGISLSVAGEARRWRWIRTPG
jgi:hypothetical protein